MKQDKIENDFIQNQMKLIGEDLEQKELKLKAL